MFDRHPTAVAALLCVLATAGLSGCGGGGGGGGGSDSTGLSAGANRTVLTSEPLSFTASASSNSGITQFAWRQTAGASVNLIGAQGATVSIVAPDRATTIELEVIGSGSGGGEVARDRVVVQVQASRTELRSELRSTIAIRGGGEGRAISSAVHTASNRLFVIDGVGGDVLAYDVSSPSSPNFLGVVTMPDPTPGFSPGAPLAVAAGDSGFVAITWTGETPEFPGIVQFVDPSTLQSLAQISTSGANPVDIEASADGLFFAVACAGDAFEVGAGDGLGYVTLMRVPAGGPGAIQPHAHVAPIVLNPFDGDESELAQAGIRFFRDNNPTASVELTPRSIAISPDGETVWASCPDNDALVVIDVDTRLITDLVPLEDRSFGAEGESAESFVVRQAPTTAPTLLTTAANQDLPFGGITGIASMTVTSFGAFRMQTVSAAGVAVGAQDRDGNGVDDITLVDPTASHALQTSSGILNAPLEELELVEAMTLTGPGGAAITGRPGLFESQPGLAGHDEEVLDLDGNAVATDSLGARFGGATTTQGGQIWLGEMRRNGLWRFSPSGALVQRYVPSGTPGAFGSGVLPSVFSQRRLNLSLEEGQRFGGFGAVAFDPERNSILAVTRLPLDNPDSADDAASRASRIARMIELNASTGALVGEYAVVLEEAGHAFEGMTSFTDPNEPTASLYLLESATDAAGFRGIFRLDLDSATNLRALSSGDYADVSSVLEATEPADLSGLTVPITPVGKKLRVDLRSAGLGGGVGRPSALANAGGIGLYVAFDDGFQLASASVASATGEISGISGQVGQLGGIALLRNSADFSGSGTSLSSSSLPIHGLTQPLDLVAMEVDGIDRLITANGGLARVLEDPMGGNPYDERARLGGLLLDTNVFTQAAQIQDPANAGELRVSLLGSDANDDMLVDRLLAFGGRSISLRDSVGREVWRSGRSLERRAHEERPDRVAEAATLYGIRPSSLALGMVSGNGVLAAGLEEAGSVMLFDLSQPGAPLLAGVGSRALRPVDVDIAPIAGTTLFVTDQATGQIEVRRITRL